MKPYKMVVAEDERIILRHILSKLDAFPHPFEVIAAVQNGQDALTIVENEPVNLLLTDIRMPALDGLALTARAKLARPALRVILLTGHAEFTYARQALKLGVDDYLLKPIRAQELARALSAVQAALDGPDAPDAAPPAQVVGDTPDELVQAVRAHLQAHCGENLSLEDIARRFQIAPSHLIKLFKRYAGATPINCLIQARMQKARQLLTTSELDVRVIAAMVGYEDSHYFSRLFKNTTGLTPSEYRNRKPTT